MVPYSYLIGRGHDHDGQFIEVLESRLRQLLKPFLLSIDLDEDWYLKVNDDVRAAMQEGRIVSVRDHYATAGYFEDRLPRPVTVDEAWYLRTYPDVAAAIRVGDFQTAQQHFGVDGFKEGRLPSAGWSLLADGDRGGKAGQNSFLRTTGLEV